MPDNLEDTRPKPTRPVVPVQPTHDQPTPGAESPTPPHGVPIPTRPGYDTAAQRPSQPVSSQPMSPQYRDEVPAPPRFLFWAVIIIFVLGILGSIAVVGAFRFVLEPAQQQRVMDAVPFMKAFLPPRPGADAKLPTPEGSTVDTLSPDDLLSGLLDDDPTATPTLAPPTATPTFAPTSEPTATTEIVATIAATEPPTVAPPTEAPTLAPTDEAAVPQDTTSASNTTSDVSSLAVTQTYPPRPSSARLNGFNHQQQTWNNCGPANITMALSFYGWQNDQAYAMSYLRPGGREDRNVNPWELADFVNTQSSVRALTRMGGTLELIKQLLANEIPVIIETGFMPEGYDWLGHYRTLVAYDDGAEVFWVYDSFMGDGENGEGVAQSYTLIDSEWQQFNRRFLIVYEPQREELVRRILGDYADPLKAAEIAKQIAREEAEADKSNEYAWFNLGTSLVELGDYETAANAYALALREGLHWRTTFYQFGIYEAYYEVGRYQEILSLVDSSLANGGNYVEETYYWQGRALAALGQTADARTAFNRALQRHPSYQDALDALELLG